MGNDQTCLRTAGLHLLNHKNSNSNVKAEVTTLKLQWYKRLLFSDNSFRYERPASTVVGEQGSVVNIALHLQSYFKQYKEKHDLTCQRFAKLCLKKSETIVLHFETQNQQNVQRVSYTIFFRNWKIFVNKLDN